MRLAEAVLVLAILAGAALLVRAALTGSRRRAVEAAPWAPYHRFEDAARVVYVRRGDELEPVGEVASADPHYEDAFLALMDRARERAAALNAER